LEISGQIFIKERVAAALEDAVLKLWDLNKAVIIQTLSLHFPAFSVLGKEVRTLLKSSKLLFHSSKLQQV
jgi:hypothetical protein